jgi:hypothetical protein
VEDSIIKLELTLNEVNGILSNLGKLPYEQVFPLIEKIRAQGLPQAEEIAKLDAAFKEQQEKDVAEKAAADNATPVESA